MSLNSVVLYYTQTLDLQKAVIGSRKQDARVNKNSVQILQHDWGEALPKAEAALAAVENEKCGMRASAFFPFAKRYISFYLYLRRRRWLLF